MRILLVEDDSEMARSIELLLASEGIICDKVEVGVEGVEIGKIDNYDLIILDLVLPDITGFQVLCRLRAAKVKTPILILSGVTCVEQKIKGLNRGADDYLTKPFVPKELIARINAIVRRSKGHSESIVRFDKVCINLDIRNVEINGVKVHLTNKEYAILELLALRKDTVLSKEDLLNHLYNDTEKPEIKIIDVFLCKLRKKLIDKAGGKNYIDTVWGRGYKLKEYIDPESIKLQEQLESEELQDDNIDFDDTNSKVMNF